MNIKTQVAMLALLHIIPLELRYGHYLLDLFLSKVVDPNYITFFVQLPYLNFTYVLYKEALIILLSLVAPKSNYISKVLFITNQPDLISFTPEKTKPKPATHWLSSAFDILIVFNILHSIVLVGSIYLNSVLFFLTQGPKTLFFITLIYNASLLSYIILLIIAGSKFPYNPSCLIQFIVSFELYWIHIIAPTLGFVKDIFLPTIYKAIL